MGKRRKKQGPEGVFFGLIAFGILYLLLSAKLAPVLRVLLPALAIALIVIGAAVLVLRKKKPQKAFDYGIDLRKAPTVAPRAFPSAAAAAPDRLRPAAADLVISPPAKPKAWSLQLIRDLEWKRFEELCEGYWKAKGYRAELTGRGADGGIDINLYSPSDPQKLLAVIQCKSRSQDFVGVATVRELFGVMHHVGAPMGMLVSSTGFHPPAREFAAGKRIRLVDGATLLKQIEELPADRASALLDHVMRGDYLTPTCPSCDVKMVLRTKRADGKGFFGCVNYPRCKSIINLRRQPAPGESAA
jgi:restriction system protein